jgi:hypothetical protein
MGLLSPKVRVAVPVYSRWQAPESYLTATEFFPHGYRFFIEVSYTIVMAEGGSVVDEFQAKGLSVMDDHWPRP